MILLQRAPVQAFIAHVQDERGLERGGGMTPVLAVLLHACIAT